jgi:beta-1,4-N-acetylglucosaminyltransferase
VGDGVGVLLVCSSGGHLLQLRALSDAWVELPHAWVVEDTPDTRSVLAGEPASFLKPVAARDLSGALRNAFLGWRTLRRLRPDVVVTTGAAIAVPFAWIARGLRIRVVYIESITRIDRPSLSCRLIAPVADRVYVQWPELTQAVRNARYAGAVLETA